MEAAIVVLFAASAFVGGLVSGLAGFAMGLLLSAVWLHFLTPLQTVTLIIGFGVWTQAYAIWRLRHSLGWRNVAPFILGGALGVPLGAMLLAHVPPAYLRSGIGLLVVLYSAYGFAQPRFRPFNAGTPADVGVGFVNGLVAGLAGLTGIVITIWCQWRGWPKDVQRAVFQPVNLAAVLMTAASLVVAGAVTAETGKLYALGLPFVLAGFWTGFRLYGKVSDVGFRKVVLTLLFVAGISLLAT